MQPRIVRSDDYMAAVQESGHANSELMHYKYIKRERVNGKWRYYYDDPNKQTTDNKVETPTRSKTEIGFDMTLKNLEADQLKSKAEEAQKAYDTAVNELHKAYTTNDGQRIGYATRQRDKTFKELNDINTKHKKVIDDLKGLMREYDQWTKYDKAQAQNAID